MNSPGMRAHAWLPRATCDAHCLDAGASATSQRVIVALRVARRIGLLLLFAPALPLLAVVLPGWSKARQLYCRLLLWCLGVRITLSGGPIRNLPGVLVVSDHMSWLDVLTIGATLPSARWRASPVSFVARADVAGNVAVRMMARIVRVIPIERTSLRQLPEVVATVAARLYAGHTVVAFPEGTTWCGLPGPSHPSGDDAGRAAARGGAGPSHQGSGPFYPAMFQAAVDTGRPVQPLRLRYHHRDGRTSTVPAFIGDDTLLRSIGRLMVARRTVARIYVESLQLPGADRRELARRCQAAIRVPAAPNTDHGQRSSVLAS
ncbi:lysophospholipid acyltransferase family protein [Mycobacterium cookii]|uniref:1-acyl-sn-glycerol-3-phosphate acyltransferase n=1 Tax=Mycobacterium cookii TaxID=1775 RepID=A0A7I7L3D9_9MYCO|nr:lysophospholipid acyltransferase family protein [Mycobacterium cookii]MCV7329267.1 1-acyl-sn-glycerol-3-phosphate acyltransferase [Mycobacterium cookii]BBX48900.1 1-acyl-sn-glycerol-3-phosphate acyltransferase [Mycobacterium cookii]